MSEESRRAGKSFDTSANAPDAPARTRSETATLALAVSFAVALGVACGVWINSLMATAASTGRVAPTRLLPAAEPRPAERRAAPAPPDESEPLHGSIETADAEVVGAEEVTTGGGHAAKRAVVAADGATHVAREVSPPSKTEERPAVAREVERRRAASRAQNRAEPCALYASAGSLTLRGGAAPLVVGGPGEAGRVTVTTPDWSNIAVLYEGRAGNGWARYTVRSVSNRPGVYAVRFATPCGSKTIPVNVTR